MVDILSVRNIKKYFPVGRSLFRASGQVLRAVDNVTLNIEKGHKAALIGESGCGKTTLGLIILRLMVPTDGRVLFKGEDTFAYDKKRLQEFRSKAQPIFQHPFASFNPRYTIRDALSRPYAIHKSLDRDEIEEAVSRLLESVELTPPQSFLGKYPHELSGGQMQRIGIARALALNPEFLVLDEPVSSLDMSVKGGILNLLNKLHEEFGLTYLNISHDLAVVRSTTDRVNVMYLGRIVESSTTSEMFGNPLHPYTKFLIASCLVPDPAFKRSEEDLAVAGAIPSAINMPKGCAFHPRCTRRISDKCDVVVPELRDTGKGHLVACHNVV
jgi:oligopeptide/dipeptide ABC transporter ATP-binding protein